MYCYEGWPSRQALLFHTDLQNQETTLCERMSVPRIYTKDGFPLTVFTVPFVLNCLAKRRNVW